MKLLFLLGMKRRNSEDSFNFILLMASSQIVISSRQYKSNLFNMDHQ